MQRPWSIPKHTRLAQDRLELHGAPVGELKRFPRVLRYRTTQERRVR